MKYTNVILLAIVAISVTAEPTKVERDLPTITSILSSVGSGISALDKSVKGFSGQAAPLMSAASSLIDTINSGTSTVSGSDELSLTDALGLQAPVTNLQTTGSSLASDLIAKKSDFEAAGLCDTISNQATSLQDASNNLIKAIISKVPSSAQSIAQNLAMPFQNDLSDAAAAFSSGNCTNSGSASSSSAGSSTAASHTAASSSVSFAASSAASSVSSASSITSATYSASQASATGVAASTVTSVATPTTKTTGTGSVPTSTVTPFTGNAANNAVGFFAVLAAAAALML